MDGIFKEFQRKIKLNSLSESDFTETSMFKMFYNKYSDPFIKKIADCENPAFEQGEDKFIFHVALQEGWEVRLDFIYKDYCYKLASLDSYTIPLKRIDSLPFNNYTPLPECESKLREEYRITGMVKDYVRLKNIMGKQEAINWFRDGQGEKAGVPAWMPYFTKRKAFIAYSAWIQNRLYGEDVYITAFSEEHSELIFRNSTWLFLYKTAAHLKCMIPYDEYLELYETIWEDRAFWNDYKADIFFENDDIRIAFTSI